MRSLIGAALLPLLAGFNARSGAFSDLAVAPRLVVFSPDGTKGVRLRKGRIEVVTKGKQRLDQTEIGSLVNAEVLWSPDSKAFSVTYSDGGNVGTYHVKVVLTTDAGLRIFEPLPDGRKLLVPRCFDPEVPNVGAIRWMGQGSSRLLIAVEVPPHSSCASMGTFRAFEIALPAGYVLASFGQIEAKRDFGALLGERMRGADDRCVQTPLACVPFGMSGREQPHGK